MRKRPWLYGLILAVTLLLAPTAARACPACADAVPASSGAEEDDQAREARAYNQSIYLMVGMPYLLVGGLGFMVYRSLRHKPAEPR
jgi:hypothetical protein